MEILIEFIFDLIFEGAMEGIKSKTLPKAIRIFLLSIVIAVSVSVMILFSFLAFKLTLSIIGRLLLLCISAAMAVFIIKLLKKYNERKKET